MITSWNLPYLLPTKTNIVLTYNHINDVIIYHINTKCCTPMFNYNDNSNALNARKQMYTI